MVIPPLDTTVMRQTTNAATTQASTTRTETDRTGVSTPDERTSRGFAAVVAVSVAAVAAAMAPLATAAAAAAVGAVVVTVAAARRVTGRATGPPDETSTEPGETTPVAAD